MRELTLEFNSYTTLEAATKLSLEQLTELSDIFKAKREGLIHTKSQTTDGFDLKLLNDALSEVNVQLTKVNTAINMVNVSAKEKRTQQVQISSQDAINFYIAAKEKLNEPIFNEICRQAKLK